MTEASNIAARRANLFKTLVIFYDAGLGAACMYAAIKLRYIIEGKPAPGNIDFYAPLIFAISIVIAWIFMGNQKSIWQFTALSDIRKLVQGVLLASILTPVLLFLFFNRAEDFPRSAPFIAGALFVLTTTFSRLFYMLLNNGNLSSLFVDNQAYLPGAILIGHDRSLNSFLNKVHRKNLAYQYNILGMIELGLNNPGRSIQGIPILGELNDLEDIYNTLNKKSFRDVTLIVTDKRMDRNEMMQLIRKASEIGAPLVRVNADRTGVLTPFETVDLIGRPQRQLNSTPVQELIRGKRVVITGAGGTIGSEIARQVLSYEPEMLSLLDISEFNLYEIDRKLARDYSDSGLYRWQPYFADITNRKRIEEIVSEQRPHIIIHAAAKKHVRLGNLNPIETLNTNVGGTQVVLETAEKYGVENFVLISTDKAVDPTTIMGASKRLAELLTLSRPRSQNGVRVSAVRFGNVMASMGSVIPLFEEQISLGGPVTVTDKNVSRFFMTVREAAELVLQAAAQNTRHYRDNNNIFVLEMGTPVKIEKLARQLIRLRGLVPDKDIKIVFTGLKPGEKLEEHLYSSSEDIEETYIDGILKVTTPFANSKQINAQINKLIKAVQRRDRKAIREALNEILPEYDPKDALSMTDEK